LLIPSLAENGQNERLDQIEKIEGLFIFPCLASPLGKGEDKGEGLELTHVTLLGLTLPLSLTKGEASQARMQPIFTYRGAN
jgi:hypothetical protein